MDTFTFQPSAYGDGSAPAAAPPPADAAKGGGWLDTLTGAFTASSSSITGWASVLGALTDPRERVQVLKAKIKNYEKMRAKYGIGPIGDLYSNEIRLMKARLKAEKKALGLQGESEDSTRVWRYAGWGLAGLAGLWVAAKAYRTLRPVEAARMANPLEDRTRWNDAHRIRQEGLAYYRQATDAERHGDHAEAKKLRKYGDHLSEKAETIEDAARRTPRELKWYGPDRKANPRPTTPPYMAGPARYLEALQQWANESDTAEDRRFLKSAGVHLPTGKHVDRDFWFGEGLGTLSTRWGSSFDRLIENPAIANPVATDAEIDRAFSWARNDRWYTNIRPDYVAGYLESENLTADPQRIQDRIWAYSAAIAARTPKKRRNPAKVRELPRGVPLYLVSAPDGWATVRDGRDKQAYRRWALAPSRDGRKPLDYYDNGGPVGIMRSTAGKTSGPPAWHLRAAGFVRFAGGLPGEQLYDVADWYRKHRTGSYGLEQVR